MRSKEIVAEASRKTKEDLGGYCLEKDKALNGDVLEVLMEELKSQSQNESARCLLARLIFMNVVNSIIIRLKS